MPHPPRHVLIVLPHGAHLMDVAGPAQVFTNAAEITGGGYRVDYVAPDGTDAVASHQGLRLTAGSDWPPLDPAALVVVPGWKTENGANGFPRSVLERIAHHWRTGGHLASICAGAIALAEAGILTGHTATTHHDLVDDLARHEAVAVTRDVLFTCEDRLHTSAGIASGIDLSLHLVVHDHGPAVAARVARTLVVPSWRSGNTSQASVLLTHRDHLDDLVHRAQDLLDVPEGSPPTLDALGRDLGVSGRTLARHFTRATGMTPQAYSTAVRREHAAQLLDQGWTRDAAARAVGYADARSLRA